MNKLWMLLRLGELAIHNHLNTVEAPDGTEKPGRDTKVEPMESGASPRPLHGPSTARKQKTKDSGYAVHPGPALWELSDP